ncbi:MAG: hypothetical protein ACK46X_09345 [Candidatus Sericytochromatia bacterium]
MTKLIAPLLLATLLTAGCTAGATTGATVGTSPAPGATAAPGGGIVGAASDVFKVGRKWVYTSKSTGSGQTTDGTFTQEVLSVTGDEAEIKTTVKMGATAESSNTAKVKINTSAQDFTKAMANAPAGTTATLKSSGKESVTVAAGTYANATKYVYTFSSPQTGDTTAEQWVDDKVGLLKMVSTTKPAIPAGVPAGFDLTMTSTMELQSVTP